MIGILLESFGKDFPEFLHPIKSVVLAVSENQKDYSEIVYNLIKDKYVLIDNSSEPLGKRIRNWKSKGVPNIIVVGDKEKMEYQDSGIISYMLDSKSEGKIKKVL